MKWIIALLFISQSISATPLCERTLEPTALQELASALGIHENLIASTQNQWLRNPSQERWEINELCPEQKQFVLNWSESQGLFSEWHPSEKTYDKALILGATTGIMKKRFNYLISLWREGIRFDEIVWLTGDRPLDYGIDEHLEGCTNESEAARVISQLPVEMQMLPVRFIAVPMKKDNKRPNTQDTLVAWLSDSPTPCKALFISDQPFCGYQSAIVRSTLPETFLFETAGPGSDPSCHPSAAAITLDSIARWIYQANTQ